MLGYSILILLLIPQQLLAFDVAPPSISSVEPKYEFALWHLRNYGQAFRWDLHEGLPGKVGADIDILPAWKIINESPNVLIAVLDHTFDLQHPDLKNIFEVHNAYNFLSMNSDVSSLPTSLTRHGTSVSGIIGANGKNKIGTTGISQRTKILPIRVLPDTGDEDDHAVASAIRYAVQQHARIINCSFGKNSTTDEVREAIQFAKDNNVLIITAAGNSGINVDENPHWPSSYSNIFENVISVAATNRLDELWEKSNFGISVDIAAPGDQILTTGDSEAAFPYISLSGTSMAAPMVSGVAALMIELYPDIKVGQIKSILIESSEKIPSLAGKIKMSGRLNALNALQRTQQLKYKNNCDLLRTKKQLVSQTNLGATVFWEFESISTLKEPFQTQSKKYSDYISWVKSKTNRTAKEILENHDQIVKKEIAKLGTTNTSNKDLVKELLTYIDNDKQILDGKIGRISPLRCQEGIPFAEFLERVDLRMKPLEFFVTILEKDHQIILLGDFYDTNENNPSLGTNESSAAKSFRRGLIANGWTTTGFYHNHPFDFSSQTGDLGGVTAPSSQDAKFLKKGRFKSAYITNGIETLELSSDDISKLGD
jgi:hypothetical protein